MKKLTKILSLAALGAGLLFTPVQKSSAQIYVSADAGFNLTMGSNPMAVNYHEDSYLPCTDLDASLGIGIKKDFSNFEIGVRGSWINAGYQHNIDDNINSIAYEGPENWSLSPGVYAKLFSLVPKEDSLLSSGGFLEYEADFMQEIWQDEKLKDPSNKLADAINQTAKLGYEMKAKLNNVWITSDIFGGVSFPKIIQLTDLGKASDLTLKPNFFVGYSVKVGLSSR
jgi:hypothetical protein